jgi:hypothetical protein
MFYKTIIPAAGLVQRIEIIRKYTKETETIQGKRIFKLSSREEKQVTKYSYNRIHRVKLSVFMIRKRHHR